MSNAPERAIVPKAELKKRRRRVLLRIGKYFWQYKFLVLIALATAVAGNLLGLLAPMISAKAINAAADPSAELSEVIRYCIYMAIFYLFSSGFSYTLTFFMTKLSRNISRKMREEVFAQLMRLPVSFFDTRQAGDVINRLTYDIDTVNASLSNDLIQIITSSIMVIGSCISMVIMSPILSSVFLLIVPITVLSAIYRTRVMRPLFRKRSGKLGELNGYSEEMLSGIRTIKGYGREDQIAERYEERNEIAAQAYYSAEYQGGKMGPTIGFINNLSTVLISLFGGLLFLHGKITVGFISAFLQYSRKFTGPINELANISTDIQSALAAAERVFGVLDSEPERDCEDVKALPEQVRGEIEFSHVKFGYVPEKMILNDVSFTAQSGKTIAIVGPTGAGKTTINNLLMRFYDVNGGKILLDGTDVTEYTRSDLRGLYTMVLQETWLFDGTIRENIAYGNPEATDEEVENAARAADLHEFIMSLPHGYETRLTDGGSNLSKGQKQLMTIARSMVSGARILILDEATSNVDTRTEIKVQQATQALMQGKTCFVVAHRLHTIMNADLILVMREGNIIEQGTHAQLLEQKGFYYSLFNAQFG